MVNIDVTSPKNTNKKGLGLIVIQWERKTTIIGSVKIFYQSLSSLDKARSGKSRGKGHLIHI